MRQFFRFSLVGLSGVAVNLTVLSLVLVGGGEYHTAAIGAFLTAASHNFYWNARWTFRLLAKKNGSMLFRYLCFVSISGACLLLNLYFLSIMIDRWQLSPIIAQTGVVLAVGVVNFWLQSVLTFRGGKTSVSVEAKAVSNE